MNSTKSLRWLAVVALLFGALTVFSGGRALFGDAAARDELARTVHYGELAEAIIDDVRRDPVDLIETVAERVAATALRFPGVLEAEITVHKPDAPIDAQFADVSVTVVRRNETQL